MTDNSVENYSSKYNLSKRDKEMVIYGLKSMEDASVASSDYNPYQISFAERGDSGLSFGALQCDVANRKACKFEFEKMLKNSSAFKKDEIDKIVNSAATPGMTKKNSWGMSQNKR